jgi:hypothetical protein
MSYCIYIVQGAICAVFSTFLTVLAVSVLPWVGGPLSHLLFFTNFLQGEVSPTPNLEDLGIPFSLGHHL